MSAESRVFPTVSEKLVRRLKLDLEFAGIAEETAEGWVDVHSLRVTAASMLANRGVDPRIAQRQLTHSDIRITEALYARLRPETAQEAIAKVPPPPGVG